MPNQFTVLGGKMDMGELNWKYANCFDTLDEAIQAYQRLGYPFKRIEYKGWIIEVK